VDCSITLSYIRYVIILSVVVGLELSKRHASAQMDHRHKTWNIPCHMAGTVNTKEVTGPWSSPTPWGVTSSPKGESSSIRVEWPRVKRKTMHSSWLT